MTCALEKYLLGHEIPVWLPRIPLSNNRYIRAHWTERRKEKSAWRALILLWLKARGPGRKFFLQNPEAWTKIRIRIGRKRVQDYDNSYGSLKPLLDALKAEGWIRDDNKKSIRLELEEYVAKKDDRLGTGTAILMRLHGATMQSMDKKISEIRHD